MPARQHTHVHHWRLDPAAGSCNAISALFVPAEQALQRQREMFPSSAQMPFSAEMFKAIAVGSAVVMMLIGAGLVTLGTGVRRGGAGSTVTALVLASILLVFLGLVTLLSLLAGLASPVLFSVSCIAGPRPPSWSSGFLAHRRTAATSNLNAPPAIPGAILAVSAEHAAVWHAAGTAKWPAPGSGNEPPRA